MLSCHATTKGCPSGPGDPARGPRARMCETMGFDRGGFSIDVAAGRENGHDVRGRKKMISASARSRRMMIKVLKSPTPTFYGDVPSLSLPVDWIMPNEVGLDRVHDGTRSKPTSFGMLRYAGRENEGTSLWEVGVGDFKTLIIILRDRAEAEIIFLRPRTS